MNKYVSIIFKHWQSSLGGLLVGVITIMYYVGKINTTDWIVAIGGIGTIIGLISKDPNKTQSKNPTDPD